MTDSETMPELKAREAELEREWTWLNNAINSVARVRAEQGDAMAFRMLQQQAMAVGQRRVEVRLAMAELEGRPAALNQPDPFSR